MIGPTPAKIPGSAPAPIPTPTSYGLGTMPGSSYMGTSTYSSSYNRRRPSSTRKEYSASTYESSPVRQTSSSRPLPIGPWLLDSAGIRLTGYSASDLVKKTSTSSLRSGPLKADHNYINHLTSAKDNYTPSVGTLPRKYSSTVGSSTRNNSSPLTRGRRAVSLANFDRVTDTINSDISNIKLNGSESVKASPRVVDSDDSIYNTRTSRKERYTFEQNANDSWLTGPRGSRISSISDTKAIKHDDLFSPRSDSISGTDTVGSFTRKNSSPLTRGRRAVSLANFDRVTDKINSDISTIKLNGSESVKASPRVVDSDDSIYNTRTSRKERYTFEQNANDSWLTGPRGSRISSISDTKAIKHDDLFSPRSDSISGTDTVGSFTRKNSSPLTRGRRAVSLANFDRVTDKINSDISTIKLNGSESVKASDLVKKTSTSSLRSGPLKVDHNYINHLTSAKDNYTPSVGTLPRKYSSTHLYNFEQNANDDSWRTGSRGSRISSISDTKTIKHDDLFSPRSDSISGTDTIGRGSSVSRESVNKRRDSINEAQSKSFSRQNSNSSLQSGDTGTETGESTQADDTDDVELCLNLEHHTTGHPHTVYSDQLLGSWYPDYVELPQGTSSCNSWVDLPSSSDGRLVTYKDLSKISKCLGFNWEFVPIGLGLAQVDIDQSKMDHPRQTAMQIYDSLCKWKARRGAGATIEELVKAIKETPAVEVNWDIVKNVADGI